MKTGLKNIVLFIFIFCVQKMYAQNQVTLNASLDSSTYLIGDYIRFILSVNNPQNYVLQLPDFNTIAPELELISYSKIDTVKQTQGVLLNLRIVYSVYDSGQYKINPVTIYYKKPGDTMQYSLTSDTLYFIVNTIPVDTTLAIKPIKKNIDVTVKNYTWLYITGGIVLLLLISWGIYLAFKKRKNKIARIPAIRPETLYEHTMKRLKELDEKKLWQKNEIKQYYVELTNVLREYLEHRYVIQAMESTSDEIIEQLVKSGLSSELVSRINYILDTADLAKFAKSQPAPAQNSLSMQYAYDFVEVTKPVEVMGEDEIKKENN